jgi:hypothetical protein
VMTPIAPHIAAFLGDYLPTQRGASPHTCDTYVRLSTTYQDKTPDTSEASRGRFPRARRKTKSVSAVLGVATPCLTVATSLAVFSAAAVFLT